jgi:hypothetical protein
MVLVRENAIYCYVYKVHVFTVCAFLIINLILVQKEICFLNEIDIFHGLGKGECYILLCL